MNIQVMLGTVVLSGLLSAQGVQKTAAIPATRALHSSPSAELTEAQKVELLLEYIRGLEGATFIRNGSEHNNKEAADHLHAKWEKHKSKISTAREFVSELASASGLTGEAYRIRFPDGTTVETKEVLMKELERIEQQ